MSVRRMMSSEGDIASGRSISIPFDFSKKEHVPAGKSTGYSIVITPITVRSWFRIKPLLATIEKGDLDKLIACTGDKPFGSETMNLMERYDETIFEIVCIGIHNKPGDMPKWFKEVLRDNCTWEDMYVLMNAIFYRLCTNSFTNTITLMKAVSPREEEIIALQANRKSWSRPATS